MTIIVKFVGVLRHASGTEKVAVDRPRITSVKELISELVKEMPKLKRTIVDPELDDPRLNVLILVNDSEISALNDLETKLDDGDTVVLVPFVHGG
jgi:MoaD family protein